MTPSEGNATDCPTHLCNEPSAYTRFEINYTAFTIGIIHTHCAQGHHHRTFTFQVPGYKPLPPQPIESIDTLELAGLPEAPPDLLRSVMDTVRDFERGKFPA